MRDLKCISYNNLKKLMAAVEKYEKELTSLDDTSGHSILLWENENLCSPANAIINYLDNILGTDDASYFAYETGFGKDTHNNGNPYCIEENGKSYPITDFDSWYEFLLIDEDSRGDE